MPNFEKRSDTGDPSRKSTDSKLSQMSAKNRHELSMIWSQPQTNDSSFNKAKSVLKENEELFRSAHINISNEIISLRSKLRTFPPESELTNLAVKGDISLEELDEIAKTKDKYRNLQQAARNLEIIYCFANNTPLDRSMIKKAISELAASDHKDQTVKEAINLIKHNPEIQNFDRSDSSSRADASSSSRTGEERVEPSPSQDTDNTMRRKHIYLDKIPDRTITDLAQILMHTTSSRWNLNPFQSARRACNKIKLFRGLYPDRSKFQAVTEYGSITKDQAATAALNLRNALNQNDLVSISSTDRYRRQLNQYYQDAGLS